MHYSAIGHSILFLAIIAHLVAGARFAGVALGVFALVLAWLVESMKQTRTAWALQWIIIVLTTVAWGLFFYKVA